MSPVEQNQLDPFESTLQQSWPAQKWTDVSILLAVSGGPDSVALLTALRAIRARLNGEPVALANSLQISCRTRLEVGHFNHQWRREASDEEEIFVRSLCDDLHITCFVGRSERSEQTEEVARNERYRYLLDLAEQRGTRYLVTAHTANDQAETILHRIIRGTSLRGLRGIQNSRQLSEAVTVVRPMLWASRREVIDYLDRSGQRYCVDDSNHDQRFTRNRIRHELLPHLAQHYNPSILESLLRLGSLAHDAEEVVEDRIRPEIEKCIVSQNDKTVELDRGELVDLSSFLQREVLAAIWRLQGWPEQSMGFEQWNRLVRSIQEGTRICLPGGVQLHCTSKAVTLSRS